MRSLRMKMVMIMVILILAKAMVAPERKILKSIYI